MLCAPTLNELVLIAAEPAASVAEPSGVAPSKNVTEPPATPAPGANVVTEAVSVTASPNDDGFGVLVTEVAVAAEVTVCVDADDVLPAKLALPENDAVMLCAPVASELVLIEAEKPESALEPSEVSPSKNVTVPLGVPDPGASTETLAVSVTDCPNTDGFGVLATVVAVEAVFTVCVCTADVLVVYVPSPA